MFNKARLTRKALRARKKCFRPQNWKTNEPNCIWNLLRMGMKIWNQISYIKCKCLSNEMLKTDQIQHRVRRFEHFFCYYLNSNAICCRKIWIEFFGMFQYWSDITKVCYLQLHQSGSSIRMVFFWIGVPKKKCFAG